MCGNIVVNRYNGFMSDYLWLNLNKIIYVEQF